MRNLVFFGNLEMDMLEAAGVYIQLSKLLDDVRLKMVYAADVKLRLRRRLKDA